eukprot:11180834-Lingulodinium_polyedra.AAC.1
MRRRSRARRCKPGAPRARQKIVRAWRARFVLSRICVATRCACDRGVAQLQFSVAQRLGHLRNAFPRKCATA